MDCVELARGEGPSVATPADDAVIVIATTVLEGSEKLDTYLATIAAEAAGH